MIPLKYSRSICLCSELKVYAALIAMKQLADAVAALRASLTKAEVALSGDHPCHGDIHTVTLLVEQHRVSGYL